MIAVIGLMIGTYIIARMLDLIVSIFSERENLSPRLQVFLFTVAGFTILIAVVGIAALFESGKEIQESLQKLQNLSP